MWLVFVTYTDHCLGWMRQSVVSVQQSVAGLHSNKQCKFLHILQNFLGSKRSKDFRQIKTFILCFLLHCQRKPVSVFRFMSLIFLIYLNSFTSKSCTDCEYAGTKQQLSISTALVLLEKLWEHEFVRSKVLFLTFSKERNDNLLFKEFIVWCYVAEVFWCV